MKINVSCSHTHTHTHTHDTFCVFFPLCVFTRNWNHGQVEVKVGTHSNAKTKFASCHISLFQAQAQSLLSLQKKSSKRGFWGDVVVSDIGIL